MSNLVKQSTRILGGSAIAAIGFGLGRDIYGKAKKNKSELLGWLILTFMVLGMYFAGVWIARNYKTTGEAILKRFAGCLMAFPGIYLLFLMSKGSEVFEHTPQVVDSSVPTFLNIPIEEGYFTFQSMESIQWGSVIDTMTLPLLLIAIGVCVGLIQRTKRTQVWHAETHNEGFLKAHQIEERENGQLFSHLDNQLYRVESVKKEMITLFAIGRRNKRAYIQVDEYGKYSDFSGLVNIG